MQGFFPVMVRCVQVFHRSWSPVCSDQWCGGVEPQQEACIGINEDH